MAEFKSLILDGNEVVDCVVEQGTSGIWTYRKWASGIAECWGTYFEDKTCTATWGSTLYECENGIPSITYPFTFAIVPTETVTIYGGHGFMLETTGRNTTTQTASYFVVRPNAISTTFNVYLHIDVKGRWK